ncbi:MAG: ribonuclease D [Gammaproteobacteria bacterium]|nr:MAG: ribonuclease D [Gammaproteobacteria bacterium]
MTVHYIDTPEQLTSFCSQIADAKWLTVDTEFLREKTYSPQLCLIQVATEEHIACIDPLALEDINPILDIIYNPDITVVFHAARQDLEIFYLLRGALPNNVFDTQVAATVLGYGEQIGYGNLVKQCLDVDLDKAHSRTDWTKRPLDPAQISYAADDVRYLRDVYKLLKAQLEQQGRTHWLDEDFAVLTNSDTYRADPDSIWRKVKGFGRLKGQQLAILKGLAAWREQRAVKSNRPRRWILKDDILLDLAKLAPDTIDKFSMIRGFEAHSIKRLGDYLLAEITAAQAIPKDQWPILKKTVPLSQQQNAIVDTLMALLRKYCDEQSISPAAVSSRKEIERLVSGEKDLAISQGWRNEIVGQHLQAFLDGKLSITADSTQLKTR